MLSEQEMQSLAWLQWHWDSDYVMQVRDGVWMARRLGHLKLAANGAGEVLTAGNAHDLRSLVRDDYAKLAVQRLALRTQQLAEGGSLRELKNPALRPTSRGQPRAAADPLRALDISPVLLAGGSRLAA